MPYLTYFLLQDGNRFKKHLIRSVPNAFFEKTLLLVDRIDNSLQSFFVGLMKLTFLDTVCLALGLWLLGVSFPLLLGLIAAVLAWVPYVGSVAGGALAGASTFALGKAFCYYFQAVHQGHVPKAEDLRRYYHEQLTQAEKAWKSEVRDHESRDQKSEIRDQKSEIGSQYS